MNDRLSRRFLIGAALAFVPLGARAQNGGDILGNILNQVTRGGNGAGAGVTGQAPSPPGARGAQLNQNDIGLGLKDALKIATQRTVGRVGKNDGYNADPAIRIPLPGPLQQADNALRAVGGGFVLDDLRVKMNRAAEQAAPKALNIFVDAASQMSFEDARMILTGPDDAATQFFKRTTSQPLTKSFRPIVDSSLSGVGAVKAFGAVQQKAQGIPFLGQSLGSVNLTDFTVGKAMDGLFYYLAVEEKSIRQNPVARTTDLLRRVFG